MTAQNWLRAAILLVIPSALLGRAVAAQTPEPAASAEPIRITSCRAQVKPGTRRAAAQGVAIVSFAVDDASAADVVRFRLVLAHGAVGTFVARGSFSPGTLIRDRHLPMELGTESASYKERWTGCRVIEAHFVDGSSWRAPA
jgi:hypothetical protein